MFRALLVSLSVLLFVPALAVAAAPEGLTVLPSGSAKDMMHTYLMGRVHEALDRREADYEKLKTPEQLAGYQKRMKQYFLDQLGPMPERTPLNPQVVGKLECDGYRIEKVIFESRPKFFVTANLYLPQSDKPVPGVLIPCGHSRQGKAADLYHRAGILMAKCGMAALCYDPIDQGERCQLLDDEGKPVEWGTTAHSMIGVGATLLGRNTASFRVWDGMRAIDYLQSRPEVDPERIGCTGNSGGGTMTSYLMALDDRIDCAAPSCYLTGFRHLLDTIGPQDAEQNIFGQVGFGLDHASYVTIRAPRPTLLCAATHDFFAIDGTWTLFREAKRFYTRLGHAERVDLIEVDAKHGFHKPLREGAARWMRRWLLEIDDAVTEPEPTTASEEELRCTPGGQVMLLEGARSTFDVNLDEEKQLAETRRSYWADADSAKAREEIRKLTGIRPIAELPEPKVEKKGSIEREGYRIDKLVIVPEPGIVLPSLCFVPEKPGAEAVLYLHAEGKQVDAAPGGPIEKSVKKGVLVLSVDLRGLGETGEQKPGGRGIPRYVGTNWKELYMAYLLGTSYLAMRAEDVLQCARVAATYGAPDKPREVHLHSIGLTGPAALHAAALEPDRFRLVTIRASITSWTDVLRTRQAENQFCNVVHGALRVYDLPDLLRLVPDGKAKFEQPPDLGSE